MIDLRTDRQPRRVSWLLDRPVPACGLLAILVRVGLVVYQWTANPLVRRPALDGDLYAQWAARIAAGDLAGTAGDPSQRAWILNPLYAYAIAPAVRLFAEPVLPILVLQAVLGAATVALATAAAARTFGRAAAWTAGLLTTFAMPLAELDAHLAVAELAAFLIAGACFACAPPTEGDRRSFHGPVAAGVWLGIGALARPVTLLALPLVAWRFGRASPGPVRAALVVVVSFFACAIPSLTRNWIVTGEPSLYTVSGGLNAHLGNNPKARESRTMSSPLVRMGPALMWEDGTRHVAAATGQTEQTGQTPTRAEVGAWFSREAMSELSRAPGASLAHYAHKARWCFGPAEVPSSASLAVDRHFAPWLGLACVPAWLVASLAVAGLWAARRRAEVLCGPGAIVFAHVLTLTIVFPLSHYRAPALPAMAILGGGAVAAALSAWREGRRRTVAALVAIAAGTAVLGALPPRPDPLVASVKASLSRVAERAGDQDGALRYAREVIDAYREQRGTESERAWLELAELQMRCGRLEDARATLDRTLTLFPKSLDARCLHSQVLERTGDILGAVTEARAILADHPDEPAAHCRLGEALSWVAGSQREAVQHLGAALDAGLSPDPMALRRVGIRR